MSEFTVDVVEVDEVLPHPNAQKLELALVGGWQVCTGIGKFSAGDKVVYFEPDTMLPKEIAEDLGVIQYCQERKVLKQDTGLGALGAESATGETVTMYRVRQTRLRGEPSFGFIAPLPEGALVELGDDVANVYGAIRYFAPVMQRTGKMQGIDFVPSEFLPFTSIQNARKQKFAACFEEGEEVICTEKIHGTQVRLGLIGGEWYAASKKVVRGQPEESSEWAQDLYWSPYNLQGVQELMMNLAGNGSTAVQVFGETFGKVQTLNYGQGDGIAFRVFGIALNGDFLDHRIYVKKCAEFNIKVTPIVYRGPFDLKVIAEHSEGKTLVNGDNIREGVVIQPKKERKHPKLGRLILKYVSDTYLLGEHASKEQTDE